jgi:cell division protein FtsW
LSSSSPAASFWALYKGSNHAKTGLWGTDSYRWKRLTTFVNPDADPQNTGYQIRRSVIALGTGGWLGVGLGESREKQRGNLPAQRTDFIFAIIGEELGLAGTVTILALFLWLILQGFHIANKVKDPFASLLAAGITGLIAIQTIINVGVVTASLPTTGVPLPFISFGGTSLVVTLFSMGILLKISELRDAHRPRREGAGER